MRAAALSEKNEGETVVVLERFAHCRLKIAAMIRAALLTGIPGLNRGAVDRVSES